MEISAAGCNQAAQALRQSSIPALRRLSVEETEESLVLSGWVPSYYYKQLAQETVLPLINGRSLVNRVTVQKNGDRSP